jgi:hypothetical protein
LELDLCALSVLHPLCGLGMLSGRFSRSAFTQALGYFVPPFHGYGGVDPPRVVGQPVLITLLRPSYPVAKVHPETRPGTGIPLEYTAQPRPRFLTHD